MKKLSGIKITHVYIAIATLIVVTAVVVGISMGQSSKVIRELQVNTEEYIDIQEAIESMKEASDYLTEHCRAFVVSGDNEDINLYFEEANVTKRRDKSIEIISKYTESESIQRSLEESLKMSNALMEVEEYAMKLSQLAHGIENDQIDDWLGGVVIDKEDLALSDADKIAKATSMVFDDNYESYKTAIRKGVFEGLDKLIKDTRNDQFDSYRKAYRISAREHGLYFVMILLTLAVLLITAIGVIVPINRSSEFIRKNESLPENGTAEYNFLARTFNKMLEKNLKHSQMLSYEVAHDDLTGLYNRKMFEEKREELAMENTALILFDVDFFKEVNDTYGHQIGDRVLQKVSDALLTSFRHEDYVCRIGGDEFAVIMVRMSKEHESVIRQKILLVSRKLAKEDELPQITISAGAAFSSDAPGPEAVYRNADAALYKVKRNGKNGFAFFSEFAEHISI